MLNSEFLCPSLAAVLLAIGFSQTGKTVEVSTVALKATGAKIVKVEPPPPPPFSPVVETLSQLAATGLKVEPATRPVLDLPFTPVDIRTVSLTASGRPAPAQDQTHQAVIITSVGLTATGKKDAQKTPEQR